MKIRLFAFDLDGTILHHQHALSPRNAEALRRAHEQGVEIVPATGRMRTFLPPSIAELPFIRDVVSSNGAAVYDRKEKKVIYENMMPSSLAEHCFDLVAPYHVFSEVYVNGEAYTDRFMWERRETEFGYPPERVAFMKNKTYHIVDDFRTFLHRKDVKVEKYNMPYVPETIFEDLMAFLEKQEEIVVACSGFTNIELNNRTTSKADGLRGLGAVLGISAEEMMTIGDTGNDVSMLRYAGLSVAVANASAEAKAAAKVLTDACTEDGVAKAIEKYLL